MDWEPNLDDYEGKIFTEPTIGGARRYHYNFALECRKNFKWCCENSIRIVNKEGQRSFMKLNNAQNKLYEKCKEQLEKNNQIRLVIIKGRQQGISTFCRAMILWKLCYYPQTTALIVSQREKDLREKAFRGLIDMYNLKLQQMPASHQTSTQLKIDHGRSGYSICFGEWAATEGQSRGDRYDMVHLTEVDYYPDWIKFWGGLSQSIPTGNRSMVLIESTSAGRKALWEMYQQSLSKDSPFEHVFIPWFDQEEYRLTAPKDFEPNEKEKELRGRFKLDDDQLFWYRQKRLELGSDIMLAREYPNTPEEAFSVSSNYSFFDYDNIQEAIKQDPIIDNNSPLVVGIDPSRMRDKTAIVWRQGRNVSKVENLDPFADTMFLARVLYNKIVEKRPHQVFIDIGGLGCGVYDRLREMGVIGIQPVNFGEAPDDKEKYFNRRAEMYGRAKEWLANKPVHIVDHQEFLNQLLMIELDPNSSKVQLISKSKMLYSPDLADAFVMTFYERESQYYQDKRNYVNVNIQTDWNPYDI